MLFALDYYCFIFNYLYWSVAMMEIDNLKQHNLNSKNPFPDGGAVRGFVLLTHY